ncbi:GntR family transcriptional regulator [Phenylobacterium sp.]|uniref:GntR family transcriptional regulator n=1 Tax=Phenylobacterium sp. TaxID=1871053 RepID=UPI002F3FBAE1
MAIERAEPFQKTLTTLRERLRAAAFPAGTRLAATLIAQDLRLSPTPVREALSRLVGEGLLEDRRGQGFFVRMPTGSDLADLYRLHLAQLLIVLDPARPLLHARAPPERGPEGSSDGAHGATAVLRTERLFLGWMADGGSRALIQAYRKTQDQLGPARRLEARVLPSLEDEASALEALDVSDPAALRRQLRHFHSLRLRVVDRLAALLEQPGDGPQP